MIIGESLHRTVLSRWFIESARKIPRPDILTITYRYRAYVSLSLCLYTCRVRGISDAAPSLNGAADA